MRELHGEGGSVVFFFQAEDGIRDLIVTGVQTCALPICTRSIMMKGTSSALGPMTSAPTTSFETTIGTTVDFPPPTICSSATAADDVRRGWTISWSIGERMTRRSRQARAIALYRSVAGTLKRPPLIPRA